ncbi:MAG: dihydroorotate dehydrogenase [Candidatus Gastranaerophilales bacterium]|nr:dihydroorotate dehydrogenase [Candidatus Gastranaerophilales bacterium]
MAVKTLDLSVEINGFEMKNPIITASGTYGYNNEFDVFCDVKALGAIVTKGITLEPRSGNEGERIFETTGGMINRIGLENIGIEAFLKEKLPVLNKCGIDFILNIAGNTPEDYIKLAQIAQKNNIKAIELNVSCPNVQHGCIEFGTNKQTLYELVQMVRKNYEHCLIVKLSPNVTSAEEIAEAAQNGGADAVSAINTVRGMGVKLDFLNGRFKKTTVSGGLSGQCIKPVALSFVDRISKVIDIPIIAIGGITSFEDVLEFFSVGAKAVQIGTANFTHPNAAEKLVNDLKKFMIQYNFSNLSELQQAVKGV